MHRWFSAIVVDIVLLEHPSLLAGSLFYSGSRVFPLAVLLEDSSVFSTPLVDRPKWPRSGGEWVVILVDQRLYIYI